MELHIYDKNGNKTDRKVTLNDSIFGAEVNNHSMYLDVKQYLANQRQGTHKAKERAEIAGSTKKLKKQKGTGTARAGSIKSPLFKGGGRVFGPRPRSYEIKLNKKLKKLSRISALSYKALNDGIKVIEDLSFETPKTKTYLDIIGKLELNNKKTLLVLGNYDKNVYLSTRNVEKANTTVSTEINTYDILNAECVVLSESAIAKIENVLS
jgi:large subunit ribosomal protein L4